MGRKAKANKFQSMKQPLSPKSPEQTAATDTNHVNFEVSPLLSGTSKSGKKKLKTYASIVRRSRRLHPSVGNQEIEPVVHDIVGNQEIEPVIHEIPISESENGREESGNGKEGEPNVHQLDKSPEQTSGETVRRSEKANPGVADIKYKTMYINSQKKIEALMEENKELNKALEHAIGKIDVYEKQSNVYSEVMDVIASLSKVNENLSAQVKRGCSVCNSEDGGVRSPKRNKTGQS